MSQALFLFCWSLCRQSNKEGAFVQLFPHVKQTVEYQFHTQARLLISWISQLFKYKTIDRQKVLEHVGKNKVFLINYELFDVWKLTMRQVKFRDGVEKNQTSFCVAGNCQQ